MGLELVLFRIELVLDFLFKSIDFTKVFLFIAHFLVYLWMK